ncbi:hypothetical protein BH11ACT3_BH11ACT3_08160 [soil metagenome]
MRMRTRASVIVALSGAALMLLTACGTGSPMPTPTGTPPPFLDLADDGTHSLPPEATARLEVDPASARYQGDWQGRSVFLASSTHDHSAKYPDACLIVGTVDGDDDFQAACGRTAFAVALLDYGSFRYNPDGFADGLEGYTAVGAWVAALGGTVPAVPAPTETPAAP